MLTLIYSSPSTFSVRSTLEALRSATPPHRRCGFIPPSGSVFAFDGTPGRESRFEATDHDLELFRRAVDVQDGIFSIRGEEQGEPVLADFDVCVVVRV